MSGVERIAALAGAGALGTIARFWISRLVQELHGGTFPAGTLVVNALGCFSFGLVWSLAAERLAVGPETRVVALVGFLGAFTTFSSFAFETVEMLRAERWWLAGVNLAAHNLLGIALLMLGIAVARTVLPEA
jgi:CrcB protein